MITDYKTYEEAKAKFAWDEAWDFFDGNRQYLNIAHECIDRHDPDRTAIRIQFADRHREEYTFGEISALTSKFAHAMEKLGVAKGDRVCVLLDPCLEYYVALFGTIKRGAVVVPCFTGFGKDGLIHRLKDSGASVLVTTEDKVEMIKGHHLDHVITVGEEWDRLLKNEPESYPCKENCSANDVAVYQYTSGTTKKFPDAIKHFHKSVVVGLPSGLFNMGLTKEERFFCPSSPAWGHGLWYGTFAPLVIGTAVGTYSGKFDAEVFLEALQEFKINNISAAPTVFRIVKNAGIVHNYKLVINKVGYTGEPMDSDTFEFIEKAFGVRPTGGYGSTEVGPLIMHFAGFEDWKSVPGSLGKPMIGIEVAIIGSEGNRVPPGQIGEIAVMRKGQWFRVKDAAVEDEDGYYWHKGRVDDVIISAGWTISPVEIESKLQKHKNVLEAAVTGKPDKDRGQIVKAYVKTDAEPTEELKKELQDFVKLELSKHEYPREIEFVEEIPKTEGGKINRREINNWVQSESTY